MRRINKTVQRQIREIPDNIVEKYLKEHPDLILSPKNIQRRLNIILENKFLDDQSNLNVPISLLRKQSNIKLRKIRFLSHNSHNIEKIQPLSVGSCKYKLDTFRYKSLQ